MLNLMTLFKMSIAGFCMFLTGAAMNFIAMFFNGGKMPAFMDECSGYEGAIINARHVCASATTHAVPLTDYIRLGNYIYSPGDFLIFAGQVLCVTAALLFLGICLTQYFRKYRRIK